MKKFLAILLAMTMMFSMIACGGETQAEEAAPPATETTETQESVSEPAEESVEAPIEETAEEPAEEAIVDVEKNLFSVELHIPADYVDEGTTQESLDELATENGYKSATLNADGSATYVMTKDQHKTMMEELRATIDENLADMVSSGDYPSVVDIKANDDYTAFDVTLNTDTVSFMESIVVIGCDVYGSLYNVFNGKEVENIAVSFINQDTGEIIHTANSKDAQ